MVPAASEGLGLYTFVRALVRDLGPWWMKVSIHTLNAVFNGPRATPGASPRISCCSPAATRSNLSLGIDPRAP